MRWPRKGVEAALASCRERRRLLDSHTEQSRTLGSAGVHSGPKGVDASLLEVIRKYLVHLEYMGKAVGHLEYPVIGRPVRKYKLL